MTRRASMLLPLPAFPLAGYLALLLIFPLASLLVTSFWSADFFEISRVFTLKNYEQLLQRPLYVLLILKSFRVGLWVALVTVPLSFIVAYVLTFRVQRWSSLLLGLLMASMLSSYLIRIYAWKAILGPSGVVNMALISLGITTEPLSFLLYGNFAIVLTLVHVLLPIATLPIYAAMQNIDRQVLEASRDLGAGGVATLFRVLIPLAMPGIVGAFLTCFILASADYVTPQLVGGADGVMIGRVIADQFGSAGNAPLGAALSMALLLGFLLVLGCLWLLRRLGRGVLTHLVTRSGSRRARTSGLARHLRHLHMDRVALGLIFFFLYAPLLVVFLFSFNSSTSGIFPMRGLTLGWYQALLHDPMFYVSLKASLIVAVSAVVGCLVIGVPAAFMIVRRTFVLRQALVVMSVMPLALPGVVMGVAFLATLGVLAVKGGIVPTALAHIFFCLPFLIMTLTARLKDYDRQVEEAGRDLGSSATRVLRTVTLPILAPTLAGIAILIFGVSLDEFIITNFVIGANSTLPTMVWGMTRIGVTPTVNALASMTLIISLALVLVSSIVSRRR